MNSDELPDKDQFERSIKASTVALMRDAFFLLGNQIGAGVAAAGFPQRPAHSSVFAFLALEGSRLTELATKAAMTPQAMAELVDDLQRLGYVTRIPDPRDGRAKLIVYTEYGLENMRVSFGVIQNVEQRLVTLLGADRVAELRSTLTAIVAAADQPDPA